MNVLDIIVTVLSLTCLTYALGVVIFAIVKKIMIKRKFKKELKEAEKNNEESK